MNWLVEQFDARMRVLEAICAVLGHVVFASLVFIILNRPVTCLRRYLTFGLRWAWHRIRRRPRAELPRHPYR